MANTKSHWSFDEFYSNHFGAEKWAELRENLCSAKKSCALINRFVQHDENLFPSDRFRRFECFSNSNLFVIEPIDENDVPRPINSSHYALCAASLLPVVALDVQSEDQILDLCASPGGKSLAIAQQIDSTNSLTSNEMSHERFLRLKQTLRSFLPSKSFPRQIRLTNFDGRKRQIWTTTFDKILVDAPCSSERHLIQSNSTHFWSVKRSKENSRRQLDLLRTAMRNVKPNGGRIVYSTCSLSPYENDLLVEQFINEFDDRIRIRKEKFSFGEETKFGWIVLPRPWGPIYLAIFDVQRPTRLENEDFSYWKTEEDESS